jgi:hypothetical protein
MALIVYDQCPAVDQQLGPQGQQDHEHQDQQRDIAAPDRSKPAEFLDGQWVESDSHSYLFSQNGR